MAERKVEGNISAYPAESIVAQSQEGPGKDREMNPHAFWTLVENYDAETGKPFLEEYRGNKRLNSRKALITGGDSGIGLSAALLMAREGADITIVYLPEEKEDAEYAYSRITGEEKRKCLLVPTDLSVLDNCKKVVEAHIETHGRIDILVNNAARQVLCPKLDDIDLGQVEKTFRLNILSFIALTKYALPYMKRGSSIINSASVGSYMGNPDLVDYTSTKGAIAAFTKSLSKQTASRGIRVNAIAPGIIYTPLQPASNPSENMEKLGLGEPPLIRPGQPAELGVWFVHLAAPGASYITGSVVHINGGLDVAGS